ncbi:helix-turn-helix domain-containing protein [Paenibacillus daejeonensis]|uniref:helix-turn-helix domain-containing protein n=1 Tax=Paenibacillus daejeonensis TaxID=135193 RepID=UPI000367FDD0|nr:helix-turn-helix domain-containing protein [Paenibacillus daejeonensis]
MKSKDHLPTRGIVHAAAGREKFHLARFEPGPELLPFVEHYWFIRYTIDPQTPFSQTVLSYPNVHLAFEAEQGEQRALVYGVPLRPFVRQLSGTGYVLGVKFRAGGFYPFWKQDVNQLTGLTVQATGIFGADVEEWKGRILSAEDEAAMAEQAEQMLLTLLPVQDEQATLAGQITIEAMNDRSLTSVEQMSERYELSVRQLQRLFRRYVGVSPKWVIKRFRLQEAAERLEQDSSVSWAELAVMLGYSDQAHFIKDFKAVVGQSPAAYSKSAKTSPT